MPSIKLNLLFFVLLVVIIGFLSAIFRYFFGFIIGIQGMVVGFLMGLIAGNFLVFSEDIKSNILKNLLFISLISLIVYYVGFLIGIGFVLPDFVPHFWFKDLIDGNTKEIMFGIKKRGHSLILNENKEWWIFFNLFDMIFLFAFTFAGIAISRPKKDQIPLQKALIFSGKLLFAVLTIFLILLYFYREDIKRVSQIKSEQFVALRNIELFKELDRLFDTANPDDIIKLSNTINKTLEKQPNFYELNEIKARLYILQNKFDDSLSIYSNLIDLLEKRPKSYYIVNSISFNQFSLNNYKSYIHLCRAKNYMLLNNYSLALEDIDTASKFVKNSRNIYFTKAMIYHKIGEFKRAVEAYNNTISITPVNMSPIDFINTSILDYSLGISISYLYDEHINKYKEMSEKGISVR